MTETGEKKPHIGRRVLKRLRSIIGGSGEESKVEKERRLAQEKAEWAVTKFISAEVQIPKRSISGNKHQPNTSVAEVAGDEVTIVRVFGGMRHRGEKHFWFVLVNQEDKTHVFSINPIARDGKDREVLEAEVEGYKLIWCKEYSGDKRNEPVPVEFFLNEVIFREQWQKRDIDLASSERVDIMFGGSPEVLKSRAAGLKRLVPERNNV